MAGGAYDSGVYEIVNVHNGKRYVGSSVKVRYRIRKHRAMLIAGKHHSPKLQRAWDKHGCDAFEFRQILVCAQPNLIMYEQRAMDVYKPEYNVLPNAGSAFGWVLSDDHKRKIGDANRGKEMIITPAHREALSRAAKGKSKPPRTKAHCENIAKSRVGITFGPPTEATRNAISAALVGRKLSAAHVAKVGAALRGIKHSPERAAKAAAARLGKKRGPYKSRKSEVS